MAFHEKTQHAARGKWRGILQEFGVSRELLTGKHSPCPLCGGTDRFRFDNQEQRGTWICNSCGAGDGLALAMRVTGRDFADVASEIDKLLGNVQFEPDKPTPKLEGDRLRQALRDVARATKRLEPGDVVHRYLASRCIEESVYPKSLRYAPRLTDGAGGVHPAMVATVVDVEGKPVSLHRTYLKPDGSRKAEIDSPRRGLGPMPGGACVRLCDDWHGGPLGIAEGIESAMAASAFFDMPVWASLNAGAMEKWQPPEGCTEVAIFADNDAHYRGQRAAYVLAYRMATGKAPLPVTVHIPPMPNTDWNDVWMASQRRSA